MRTNVNVIREIRKAREFLELDNEWHKPAYILGFLHGVVFANFDKIGIVENNRSLDEFTKEVKI